MRKDREDLEVLLFFEGHETALPIYDRLEEVIFTSWPDTVRKVQKTQIGFYNRHFFACVSLARVMRKALLPDPYLVLTLGLSYRLDSPRAAVTTEPYPGRWTTHIVLGSPEEIDGELTGWIRQAYSFAESKR